MGSSSVLAFWMVYLLNFFFIFSLETLQIMYVPIKMVFKLLGSFLTHGSFIDLPFQGAVAT